VSSRPLASPAVSDTAQSKRLAAVPPIAAIAALANQALLSIAAAAPSGTAPPLQVAAAAPSASDAQS
jgi:hypothetical protein